MNTLSAAFVSAFAAANAGWRSSGFRQPAAEAMLRRIDEKLSSHTFAEGSAYAAANASGRNLRFGVIEQAPAPSHSAVELLTLDFWESGHLCRQAVVIPAEAWRSALRSVSAAGHIQPPPYLFFATVDREGVVWQLRLFALFTDGFTLAPCDSRGEWGFSEHLLSKDCVFMKPLLRCDMTAIFGEVGLRCGVLATSSFRYRPDFLVFRIVRGDWQCFVVELRGFRPGVFPWYDEHLLRKEEYFKAIDPRVRFVVCNGWEFRKPRSDRQSAISWRGLPADWHGVSPAAAEWKRDMLQRAAV